MCSILDTKKEVQYPKSWVGCSGLGSVELQEQVLAACIKLSATSRSSASIMSMYLDLPSTPER